MKKIAVVAGTPVDTGMGVDYLNRRAPGIHTVSLPLENDPRACHIFQMQSEEEKHSRMKALFEKGLTSGAEAFFIYCNSLSSSFDFKALAEELDVPCVTPLDAYEELASDYSCCALIAANNQATAGIEKIFTLVNPKCSIYGTGLLFLVEDIEKAYRNDSALYTAESIVERHQLKTLCDFYKANGAHCLVLACTHFPFIHQALAGITDLPIIDPADIMFSLLERK